MKPFIYGTDLFSAILFTNSWFHGILFSVRDDENQPGEDWLLVVTDHRARTPQGLHAALANVGDISERERKLYISEGTPIIVDPSFRVDPLLVYYFSASVTFTSLDHKSRLAYAHDIKTWCAFLGANDVHWAQAIEDDYARFRRWRTDPSLHDAVPGLTPPVVSETTFARSRAALQGLYEWAVNQGNSVVNPIPTRHNIGRSARSASDPSAIAPAKNWLTPNTYRLWKAVGLMGREAILEPVSGTLWYRVPIRPVRGGANETRNVAFADTAITTGLRPGELGNLSLLEIPAPSYLHAWEFSLASGIAKNGRSRHVEIQPPILEHIQKYVRLGRGAAVRRAQRAGRYTHSNMLIVEDHHQTRGDTALAMADGRTLMLSRLDERDRLRLYRRDASGQLEPLALWLGLNGIPFPSESWYGAFNTACDRVLNEFRRLSIPASHAHNVSPYSLRHSFALYLLAALHREIDRTRQSDSEGDTEGGYSVRRYENAYDDVRDALGHRDVSTTKDYYLEPVKQLRNRLQFDSAAYSDLTAVVLGMTTGSDRLYAIADLTNIDREET